MPSSFFTSHKFVTLAELRYLLLEVLNRKDPISWYDLSFSCKEFSFNFIFAFENTMEFLKQVSVIEVKDDKMVQRSLDGNYHLLSTEYELVGYVLKKTIAYLDNKALLKQVFNNDVFVQEMPDHTIAIHNAKLAIDFPLIRSLLVNLGVARVDKEQLIVSEVYKNYFSSVNMKAPQNEKPLKTGGNKPTFFISYAHRDEEFKQELQKHFSGLVNQGIIQSWDSRDILAGQNWDSEVKENLEKADVVLFLISSDFMASQYINDVEIKKAIERHSQNLTRIIPIIIRPCDYESTPIGKYQALPKNAMPVTEWGNRDSAYLDIVSQIKKIIAKSHTKE